MQLIKREVELQTEAAEYGSPLMFAKKITKVVLFQCRKARNKHIFELRDLFFGGASIHAIANHVLLNQINDANGNYQEMKLHERFDDVPDLNTPKDLTDLLFSSRMHAHKHFYPIFVRAMASGRFTRVSKASDITPLAAFISANFEAHIRLEMWYCLSKQGCHVCLFFLLLLHCIICFV